jgi:O-glycosyl hydrolase
MNKKSAFLHLRKRFITQKNQFSSYFVISIVLISIFLVSSCKNTHTLVTNEPTTSGLTINIDPSIVYQTMDGFGASDGWRCQFVGANWPLAKRNEIADLLFSQDTDANGNPKGIGLSMWRFNVGAGSSEQGDNSFISDPWRRAECFLSADGTYDWAKQAGQQWFLNAAKQRGVEKILMFVNSPPVYYTQNQKAFSPGGWHYNIQSGYMPQYATFLTSIAQHFKNQGINIDYIAPFNEPQWDWTAGSNGWASQEGSPAANSEIASLTRLLSSDLSALRLSTQVELGEAGEVSYLYSNADAYRGNQIQDFFNTSSSDYIGNQSNIAQVISSHSYFTVWPISDLASSRSAVLGAITAVNPSLHYWESEYCILEGANTDMAAGAGRDTTMDLALYVDRIIHYALTSGNASSWSWWTALTRGDYKDGLIYLDDGTNNGYNSATTPSESYCQNDGYIRQSKLLWGFGNYSLFVRPGMKRIYAGSPDILPNQNYGLFTTSFIDPNTKKLVIVIMNYGSTPQTISINLKTGSLNGNFVAYVTSQYTNLRKTKGVNPQNISIPPNSITTLVGQYK